MMAPRVRKMVLTAHIAISVGWIGAVAAYLALDVTVATSPNVATLRIAYGGMALIAGNVIVPLAIAALVTGILVSVGSRWGLFRHYWVIISLVLTAAALTVLILETQTINHLARVATDPGASDEDVRSLGSTLVHSIGGMVVLVVVLVLNMYKPRGMTPYGWRREQSRPASRAN